jgi:hypothetical protein
MTTPEDQHFRRRNFRWSCGAEVLIPVVVALIVGLYLLLAE